MAEVGFSIAFQANNGDLFDCFLFASLTSIWNKPIQ